MVGSSALLQAALHWPDQCEDPSWESPNTDGDHQKSYMDRALQRPMEMVRWEPHFIHIQDYSYKWKDCHCLCCLWGYPWRQTDRAQLWWRVALYLPQWWALHIFYVFHVISVCHYITRWKKSVLKCIATTFPSKREEAACESESNRKGFLCEFGGCSRSHLTSGNNDAQPGHLAEIITTL